MGFPIQRPSQCFNILKPIIPRANPTSRTSWIATIGDTGIKRLAEGPIKGIHFGAGGLARALFLPIVNKVCDDKVIMVQPQRDYVVKAINNRLDGSYIFIEKSPSGSVSEITVDNIAGAFSLSLGADQKSTVGLQDVSDAKEALVSCGLLDELNWISIGVTGDGFNEGSPLVEQVTRLLQSIYSRRSQTRRQNENFFLFRTDNLNCNALVSKTEILKEIKSKKYLNGFYDWIENQVIPIDTMVDTIVTKDEGDMVTPVAEPKPSVALVVLDKKDNCPIPFGDFGDNVIVTNDREEFKKYEAWKLLAENGIHRHMFAVSALSGLRFTRDGAKNKDVLRHISSIGSLIIAPFLTKRFPIEGKDALRYVDEWIERVGNPNIPHDCFWVGQGFFRKYRDQIAPLIEMNAGDLGLYENCVVKSIAFGLRFNTPQAITHSGTDTYYSGKLDKGVDYGGKKWIYLKGGNGKKDLEVDGSKGSYDFRCEQDFVAELMVLWGKPKDRIHNTLIGDLGILKNIYGFDLTEYPRIAEKVVDYYHQMVGERKSAMEVLQS